MKKNKIVAIQLTSRESMEATVADVVRLGIEYAEKTAAMEKEIADVQKRHQEGLLSIAKQIEVKEASVFTYCQSHRAELFTDKKSVDMLLATVGFEFTPYRVEKRGSKITWGAIAQRLEATDWGAAYIREPAVEVNKDALLAARTQLKPEQLEQVGIYFDRDDNFFIRPKSQVAEGVSIPADTKAA